MGGHGRKGEKTEGSMKGTSGKRYLTFSRIIKAKWEGEMVTDLSR